MFGEWVGGIGDKLGEMDDVAEVLKIEVFNTAVEIDKTLPPPDSRNAVAFGLIIRRMFEKWVDSRGFLSPMPQVDHRLPPTVFRPDVEVAREYGLTSQKSITAQQDRISAARDIRIDRAAEHLSLGYPPEHCVGFCAAQDEWHQAQTKAQRRGDSPWLI